MNKIHPEYLNSSDVVGAVLADTPLQQHVTVGDSASGLVDQGGGFSI